MFLIFGQFLCRTNFSSKFGFLILIGSSKPFSYRRPWKNSFFAVRNICDLLSYSIRWKLNRKVFIKRIIYRWINARWTRSSTKSSMEDSNKMSHLSWLMMTNVENKKYSLFTKTIWYRITPLNHSLDLQAQESWL